MVFSEICGYFINQEKKYDNIKLQSEKDLNIVESIFIRCLGPYLMFNCFAVV